MMGGELVILVVHLELPKEIVMSIFPMSSILREVNVCELAFFSLLWAYNPVQNKDQKHPNMSLFR
jgi:hypothetical protein